MHTINILDVTSWENIMEEAKHWAPINLKRQKNQTAICNSFSMRHNKQQKAAGIRLSSQLEWSGLNVLPETFILSL